MQEISIKNIAKVYDPGLFKKKVTALRGLNLDVQRGEVFGLIGPNGAGKSTTIRLLLGLIRPDRGEIRFRGRSLRESGIQGEIGYLPENPYLYDHLNLAELLRFCGKASGMEHSLLLRRIEELLEKLELTAARKRPLRSFSKGMLQRAGICFALLHDPSLVILDEPMSGLDPVGRKLVFDLVMELKDGGKTVFFCSHILSDVERLCDRIGILVAGTLVRELQREDFMDKAELPIHLVLGPLSDSQRGELEQIGGSLLAGAGGTTLSIRPDQLPRVGQFLQDANIHIRATRTERVSLEELFLQTVEEHAP